MGAIPAVAPAATISGLTAQARVQDLAAWIGFQTLRMALPVATPLFPDPLEPASAADPRFMVCVLAGVGVLTAGLAALRTARRHGVAGAALLGVALAFCGLLPSILSGDRAQRLPECDPQRGRLAAEATIRRGIARSLSRPLAPRLSDELLRSALGHARFVAGDLTVAERLYREVLSDHPGSLAARVGLGCLLGRRAESALAWGDRAEARRELLAARALFASVAAHAPDSLLALEADARRVEALLAAAE